MPARFARDRLAAVGTDDELAAEPPCRPPAARARIVASSSRSGEAAAHRRDTAQQRRFVQRPLHPQVLDDVTEVRLGGFGRARSAAHRCRSACSRRPRRPSRRTATHARAIGSQARAAARMRSDARDRCRHAQVHFAWIRLGAARPDRPARCASPDEHFVARQERGEAGADHAAADDDDVEVGLACGGHQRDPGERHAASQARHAFGGTDAQSRQRGLRRRQHVEREQADAAQARAARRAASRRGGPGRR